MARYRVIVEGFGYLLGNSSAMDPVGFFTTFVLEARSISEISILIRPLLEARIHDNNILPSSFFWANSFSIISAIYMTEEKLFSSSPEGMTFYKLDILGKICFLIKFIYFSFLNKKIK